MTRLAAFLLVGLTAIAVTFVQLAAGYFWTSGGHEYPPMWGVSALIFAMRGGGRYSGDALIGREI